MPKISVIMPCYQTQKELLIECVNSILTQTFRDFEVWIVDDGSSASYRDVYHDSVFSDERIHVCLRENNGVSVARNYGLQQVQGDYVVFVDSDDVLLPEFFEQALTVAEKEHAELVYGCNMHLHRFQPSDEKKALSEDAVIVLEGKSIQAFRPRMVGERMHFENGTIYIGRGPWTRLIKRELAVSTPFPAGLAICEDIVWNLQLLNQISRACIVKKPWYLYRINNLNSSTKRYNPRIIEESQAGLEAVQEQLDMKNPAEVCALAEKSMEELDRIYSGFIGHKSCDLSAKEKREITRRLYTQPPWNVIRSQANAANAPLKKKLRILLYKTKLYFRMLAVKRRIH